MNIKVIFKNTFFKILLIILALYFLTELTWNMVPKDKFPTWLTTYVAKGLMNNGFHLLEEKDFLKGAEVFEEVLLLQKSSGSLSISEEIQRTHFYLLDSYINAGKLGKSLEHLEEFYAISPNNPKTLEIYSMYLSILGGRYASKGNHDIAIRYFDTALSASKKIKDNAKPTLLVLREYVVGLNSLGRYKKAEEYQKTRINILKETQPRNMVEIISSERLLSQIYINRKEYKKANKQLNLILTAVKSNNKTDYPLIASLKDGIGHTLLRLKDYKNAEIVLKESLALRMKEISNDVEGVLSTRLHLSDVYSDMNLPKKSESLYLDNIHLIEQEISNKEKYFEEIKNKSPAAKGDSSEQRIIYDIKLLKNRLAVNFNNLAYHYARWGESDSAIAMYKKSYILDDSNDLAKKSIRTKINLSDIYIDKGDFGKAEEVLDGITDSVRKNHINDNDLLNSLYSQQSYLYFYQKDYAKSKSYLDKIKLSLDVGEEELSLQHSTYYGNLAAFYQKTGEYDKAIKYYEKAYRINRGHLAPTHPDIADSQYQLAQAYFSNTQIDKALQLSRQSVKTLQQYLLLQTDLQNIGKFHQDMRAKFLLHIELTDSLNKTTPEHLADAFESLQLAHNPQRIKALAKTTLNLSVANKPNIKNELLRLQIERNQWDLLNEKMISVSSEKGKDARILFRQLIDDIEEVEKKIIQLDYEIGDAFPAYKQLINPQPSRLSEVQKVLQEDEAVLAFITGNKHSYLFLIKHKDARLVRLNTSKRTLAELIKSLRFSLETASQGTLKSFDLKASHQLYSLLIEPVKHELRDIKHLITVTDDTLQNLPFSILVTTPPKRDEYTDYTTVDWLINDFSLSQLPAIHSLPLLRENLYKEINHAPLPFIGFGDALLSGKCKSIQNRSADVIRGVVTEKGKVADTEMLKKLCDLPETAEELRTLAKLMKTGEQETLYLHERASESTIKQLSRSGELAKHRYVAFASHALMSWQAEVYNAPSEAGIVMTPPNNSSSENDGYLSSSEILNLELNADMVLLSACNTANLTESNESGLSNLSKSFFLAGSRSILASQWDAHSLSAKTLTTGLFKRTNKNKNLKHAEALRLSMKSMATSRYNHPAYWAPFILIGDR